MIGPQEHPCAKARRLGKELSAVLAEVEGSGWYSINRPAGTEFATANAAMPDPEEPTESAWDSVNRLGWELSAALDDYGDVNSTPMSCRPSGAATASCWPIGRIGCRSPSMNRSELLSLRQELEFKIEAMIHVLDLIDGDADLEPCLAGFVLDGARTDDREDESELLEHDDEDTAFDDFPIDDEELDYDWSNIETDIRIDLTRPAKGAHQMYTLRGRTERRLRKCG